MLYSLTGCIKKLIPPNRLILQTGWISWEIFIPLRHTEKVEKLNGKLELYVVPILRKGEHPELYGFLSFEERELFVKLINISKVGPRLALNIISVFSQSELRNIIVEGNYKALSKVPGIGVKRAEKLFLDLKNLFSKKKEGYLTPEKEAVFEEAKVCLINLGFTSKEAEKVLNSVFSPEDTLDVLLKKALQKLAPGVKENV
ncbi:MAG: Holliday junction branch migration protein RuvA [Thermodesulfobacteria bacterium]|nr:Holliday junction branch migration protein RuvA [Thermodesulfobacteriota bacterium]